LQPQKVAMPLSRALTIFAPHRAAEREPAASVVVFHCSGKIKWMLLVRWKKVLLRCRGPEKAAGWKVCLAICRRIFCFAVCVVRSLPVPGCGNNVGRRRTSHSLTRRQSHSSSRLRRCLIPRRRQKSRRRARSLGSRSFVLERRSIALPL
jgi:hypothetical protein